MADSTTTNYSLIKPEAGASEDTWGDKCNTNFDSLDSILGGGTTMEGPEIDTAATFVDTADDSKKVSFSVSGLSTATTRTFSFPNYDGTLATTAGTETLTNKTITSAAMNGAIDFSAATNKSTIRSDLGLAIGTNVQAYSSDLDNVSGTNTGDEVPATETEAGIVEAATTADMSAGTANKFPDASKIRAYVGAAFTSGAVGFPSSAGSTSFAHGLGSAPKELSAWMVCTSADLGYSVGDIVPLSTQSDGDGTRNYGLRANSSNIYFIRDGSALSITSNVSPHNVTAFTPGSWNLQVRGRL